MTDNGHLSQSNVNDLPRNEKVAESQRQGKKSDRPTGQEDLLSDERAEHGELQARRALQLRVLVTYASPFSAASLQLFCLHAEARKNAASS